MKLGRVQLKIMQVLWDRGKASARQITDDLNEDEPIAHSTVQTLLRKLEDKGAINHEKVDRTFVFFPLIEQDKVKHKATRELLEGVFEGSASELVAHLLRHERLSREELAEIRRLINSNSKSRDHETRRRGERRGG